MMFSTWRRMLMTALLLGASPVVFADTAHQRQELVAALRQLDALERLVQQSAVSTPVVAGERYYFDYPRLLSDLAHVRSGIQAYLSPKRDQPRDLVELSGDYRSEQAFPHEAQP